MIIFYYLLVLIYLLLAEKHAVKGEQAGGPFIPFWYFPLFNLSVWKIKSAHK